MLFPGEYGIISLLILFWERKIMKKRSWRERLGYWMDRAMSKGPIAMTGILFLTLLLLVTLIGVIAYLCSGDGNVFSQIWRTLMHTLDAGILADNPTDNIPYIITMCLATICGLVVTSILIGIISTDFESKIYDMRKGTSVVQEKNHTTIIGFDNNIYTILSELIEANANKKNACIVVLGEQPKVEMEDAIASHIPNTGTTRIICRSGSLHKAFSFERCAIENSRSVILNIHNDAEAIKSLLALSAYVKTKSLLCQDLRFVACIQDQDHMDAAEIAGEGRAEIIHVKDAIARIIANTCRHHGLSRVLTELFNFSGNEIYLESIPALTGKTLREAMSAFPNAVVVGLCSQEGVRLNPPADTRIQEGDKLALLEADDGAYQLQETHKADDTHIREGIYIASSAPCNLLVLGSNSELPLVLTEYDHYVAPGSRVIIMDDDLDAATLPHCENLDISVCTQPFSRSAVLQLLQDDMHNILLMNDDSKDCESSDAQTLLRLILLRDIADKNDCRFSITTEMRSADNQQLAFNTRVDDFVVGPSFTSLLMAQISEDRNMATLIRELLDESGSELYIKPAECYVTLGQEVDAYTLTESAVRKGEVYIGYRQVRRDSVTYAINPNKADTVVFTPGDQVIVIAEN